MPPCAESVRIRAAGYALPSIPPRAVHSRGGDFSPHEASDWSSGDQHEWEPHGATSGCRGCPYKSGWPRLFHIWCCRIRKYSGRRPSCVRILKSFTKFSDLLLAVVRVSEASATRSADGAWPIHSAAGGQLPSERALHLGERVAARKGSIRKLVR